MAASIHKRSAWRDEVGADQEIQLFSKAVASDVMNRTGSIGIGMPVTCVDPASGAGACGRSLA